MLDVYVVEEEQIENIDIETYVQGVLAGEMKNDWPLEALKAQAILARTFVLKFVDEKESTYPGADISTDIEEAQAYAPADINARIRQAVSDTRGLVLSHDGSLPYAWFHAHSGGLTELAKPGLSWDGDEPGYTLSVQSSEPESVSDPADNQALKDAQTWSASFPYKEFEAASAKQGVELHLKDGSEIVIAERGESGADGGDAGSGQFLVSELSSGGLREGIRPSDLYAACRAGGQLYRLAGKSRPGIYPAGHGRLRCAGDHAP